MLEKVRRRIRAVCAKIVSFGTEEQHWPSRKIVFWEVDAQADFMLPGGKLYVPRRRKELFRI